MSQRLTVHIIDDHGKQRTDAIARIPFAELLEFRHFPFPVTGLSADNPAIENNFGEDEEALGFLKYCKDKNILPDIAMVDVDFSYNIQYHEYLEDKRDLEPDAGKYVIEYLCKLPEKRQPRAILLTAQGNKTGQKTTELSREQPEIEFAFIDKQDFSNLYNALSKQLRKRAEYYFGLLDPEQRKILVKLIDNEKSEKKILNTPLMFGEHSFLLGNLLVGWWNVEKEGIDNVKFIVNELLDETFIDYSFQGNWKTKYKPIWLGYIENPDINKHNEVNYIAFNFLIECLYWHENKNKEFENSKGTLEIDKAFSVKVTSTLTPHPINEKWTIFRDKLVGRRVMLAWSIYHGYKEGFGTIIDFLVSGKNLPYGSEQRDVISTHLGLSKIKGKNEFKVTRDKILPDEKIWIEHFIPLLKGGLRFLNNFDENINQEIKGKYNSIELTNFGAIERRLSNRNLNFVKFNKADIENYIKQTSKLFGECLTLNKHTKILSTFIDNLK